MALASTSNDYSSLKLRNDKNNKSGIESLSGKNLDFYESMYHFKKMFPKFDSEVIETVLRANDGAVDKTIDQLLSMSFDDEQMVDRIFVDLSVADSNMTTNSTEIAKENKDNNNNHVFNDLPPSYNEFLASKMAEDSSFSQFLTSASNNSTICEPSKLAVDLNSLNFSSLQPQESLLTNSDNNTNQEKVLVNDTFASSTIRSNLAQSVERSLNLAELKSRVLIGDLPNSFLRIKLTSEQIKKFKTNIKKAKREEITSILNNKPLEGPVTSRQIKKKLNELNEQQVDLDENACDKLDTDWESRYKTMSKMYETRRLQIIQDEYLAKLMQNEEFLNEIKTNNDFMQTLNQESNKNELEANYPRNYKSSEKHVELSNAELKSKLLKMGKVSKVKLAKLGTAFTRKNKYKEAVEQSKTTCSSLFTELKTNPLDDDDDYYESNKNSIECHNPLEYPKPSRYQKAYKSFKSVLRRNSSSSSSSTPIGLSIRPTRSNRSSIVEEDFYEHHQQQPKLDSVNLNSTKFVNDLIVFDNDYSYDNNTNSGKNSTEINESNFDFSTYPYTKTVSKTTKK